MAVVFDASVLIPFFDPSADVAPDPQTDEPIERVQDRLRYLVRSLDEQGETVIIPTPVLSELLVGFGSSGADPLNTLTTQRVFRVVGFDIKAAIEAAQMQSEASGRGRLRQAAERNRYQMKFDLQIVAIAKAELAHTIYSDDKGMPKIAGSAIDVVPLARLPLPPDPPQGNLPGF